MQPARRIHATEAFGVNLHSAMAACKREPAEEGKGHARWSCWGLRLLSFSAGDESSGFTALFLADRLHEHWRMRSACTCEALRLAGSENHENSSSLRFFLNQVGQFIPWLFLINTSDHIYTVCGVFADAFVKRADITPEILSLCLESYLIISSNRISC